MSYLSPPAKNALDPLGSSFFNTYVKDNLDFIHDQAVERHGVRARRTSSTNFINGAGTAVLYNFSMEDTDGYHSAVSNSDRFTIPSGLDGIYVAHFYLRGGSTNLGSQAILVIQKNGNHALARQPIDARTDSSCTVTYHGPLEAGDYLRCLLFHVQGTNQSINPITSATSLDPFSPKFEMFKVG